MPAASLALRSLLEALLDKDPDTRLGLARVGSARTLTCACVLTCAWEISAWRASMLACVHVGVRGSGLRRSSGLLYAATPHVHGALVSGHGGAVPASSGLMSAEGRQGLTVPRSCSAPRSGRPARVGVQRWPAATPEALRRRRRGRQRRRGGGRGRPGPRRGSGAVGCADGLGAPGQSRGAVCGGAGVQARPRPHQVRAACVGLQALVPTDACTISASGCEALRTRLRYVGRSCLSSMTT